MKTALLRLASAVQPWGRVTALSLVVLVAACSGEVTSSGSGGQGGTGGQTITGGQGGAGGQTVTGGQGGTSGQGGTGGQASTGGQGGTGGQTVTGGQGGTGGNTGSGGTGGGCADACVTSADCMAPQPWCSSMGQNGCNTCFGACGAGAQCNGSNTCVSDADCNASPDAKCVCAENNCTICVLALFGGPPGFPEVLADGVWLVGWSGGLDHYSWVQFAFQTETTGTFTLLDPQGVTVIPYFDCEGSGAFTVNLGTGVVALELPAACNASTAYLDFQSFNAPGGFPPHATLGADILVMQQSIWGFQHPAGFCDAAFTTCGDPFVP